MGTTGWIVLVILVIIIVGGFLYYKNQQSSSAVALAKVQAQQNDTENKLKLAYNDSVAKQNVDTGIKTLTDLGLFPGGF